MRMISIDKYDNKYIIKGWLGLRFKSNMKRLIGIKKIDKLLINITTYGFEFYDFFDIEVKYILEYIIKKTPYGVNVDNIRYVLDRMHDLENNTDVDFNLDILKNTMKYEPLPAQKPFFEGLGKYYGDPRVRGPILDGDTGTGKTYMSLAGAELTDVTNVIIITPKYALTPVWIKSLTKDLFKKPQEYQILDNKSKFENKRYTLVTYENIEALENLDKDDKHLKFYVIIDESHNFNSSSNRNNKLISALKYIDPNVVIPMSGSVIKSYSTELAELYKMTDRRYDKIIDKRFKAIYKTPNNILKEILPIRFSRMSLKIDKEDLELDKPIIKYIKVDIPNKKEYSVDSLKTKLLIYVNERIKYYERTKPQYDSTYNELYNSAKKIQVENNDVNEKIFTKYEMDMRKLISLYESNSLMFNPEIMKIVNKFEKDYIYPVLDNDNRKKFKEASVVVKYVKLKINGEALGNIIGGARIACHRDMAAKVNFRNIIESTSKKTIIFSDFVEVLDAASKNISKQKIKPVVVYGDANKYRDKLVENFITSDDKRPLLTTYASLGTSVPLVAANVAVFLNMPFRLYKYDQALARISRQGQKLQTYGYNLELDYDEPNINSRNIDIINIFKKEVEEITGYKSKIDLDVTDVSNESFELENYDYGYTNEFSNYTRDILAKW